MPEESLNANKSLGPSEIAAWAPRDSINVIFEPLCYLINASLYEGRFPNPLKQAFVIPIVKKGDSKNSNNYRPISIIFALTKNFEKVIGEQITLYPSENSLLNPPLQFGFLKNFSTTDALLFATENVGKSVDENENVAAAFLDLSKAFDSVPHKILKKLKNRNFDEKLLPLWKHLTERHQKVTLSTCGSEWIQLYHGVPQGTVCGYLFNVFVNDMQHTVTENCSLLQYADDTMIFSSHSDAKQAVEKLNTNVKNLIVFFWESKVNHQYGQNWIFFFCKSNNNPKFNNIRLSFKDQDINVSQSVKLWGFSLTRT